MFTEVEGIYQKSDLNYPGLICTILVVSNDSAVKLKNRLDGK